MGKRHLKTLASPKTWPIPRKSWGKFITKPNPRGHKLEYTLPLDVVFKLLGKASNKREVKFILHHNHILVDGKRRKDYGFGFGLFDVLSIVETDEHFRLSLSKKGKLTILSIPKEEANKKIAVITRKAMTKGSKVQLTLNDGTNIVVDFKEKDKFKVGDSLVIELPSKKILEVLKLEKGVKVMKIRGKHIGEIATVKDFDENNNLVLELDSTKELVKAKKGSVIVVGKEKPYITIQ